MKREALLHALDKLLKPQLFKDYCPNGLQVAGCESVCKIVAGVTASLDLIEAAIEREADTLLVHHGYFWRGEPAQITGLKAKRLRLLMAHNINLIAYHLPLDVHPELGNNAQLAKVLGFKILSGIDKNVETSVGLMGRLEQPMTVSELAALVEKKLGRHPHVVGLDSNEPLEAIAWCTGAAQNRIADAHQLGAQVYLSGEISEPTFHIARELGIHYLGAGHHATERYGVKALAEWIASKFHVDQEFVDIYNPV